MIVANEKFVVQENELNGKGRYRESVDREWYRSNEEWIIGKLYRVAT